MVGPVSSHSYSQLLKITCFAVGAVKVVNGEGMPSIRHHEPGDMFIKIHVKFPDHIDPAVIQLLERALPPRIPLQKFDRGVTLEDVVLSDPDPRRQETRMDPDAMDEDDGEPRVQCGQQ